NTIAVGAVDDDDVIAEFSNEPARRESLTVYAPGVDLWCPLGWPDEDSVGKCSGTSFAAGIVSGAVALYLELQPQASVATVRDAIEKSLDTVYDDKNRAQSGAGRINLSKLVKQ
ncbi:MAG: S8/S53 family peptidase, partial [Planctomycetota bacterium]